jgi:hypothetical protein
MSTAVTTHHPPHGSHHTQLPPTQTLQFGHTLCSQTHSLMWELILMLEEPFLPVPHASVAIIANFTELRQTALSNLNGSHSVHMHPEMKLHLSSQCSMTLLSLANVLQFSVVKFHLDF